MNRQMKQTLNCLTGLILVLSLSLWSTSMAQSPAASKSGSIVVPIENLQNFGKGQLVAYLYTKVNRVEINGVKYLHRVIVPVKGKQATVTFKDIPFGEYAVAIMHDMNKDLKMDSNWLGIPNEDLGISNNVKGGPLGGPKWKGARFPHQGPTTEITSIKMWQCYD